MDVGKVSGFLKIGGLSLSIDGNEIGLTIKPHAEADTGCNKTLDLLRDAQKELREQLAEVEEQIRRLED